MLPPGPVLSSQLWKLLSCSRSPDVAPSQGIVAPAWRDHLPEAHRATDSSEHNQLRPCPPPSGMEGASPRFWVWDLGHSCQTTVSKGFRGLLDRTWGVEDGSLSLQGACSPPPVLCLLGRELPASLPVSFDRGPRAVDGATVSSSNLLLISFYHRDLKPIFNGYQGNSPNLPALGPPPASHDGDEGMRGNKRVSQPPPTPQPPGKTVTESQIAASPAVIVCAPATQHFSHRRAARQASAPAFCFVSAVIVGAGKVSKRFVGA